MINKRWSSPKRALNWRKYKNQDNQQNRVINCCQSWKSLIMVRIRILRTVGIIIRITQIRRFLEQRNSNRQRHLIIAGAEWQPQSSEIMIIRKFRSAAAMSPPAVREQSFVFGWRARFPNKSSPSLSSPPSWSANALQWVVQGLILGGESEGEEPRLLVPANQDKVTTE